MFPLRSQFLFLAPLLVCGIGVFSPHSSSRPKRIRPVDGVEATPSDRKPASLFERFLPSFLQWKSDSANAPPPPDKPGEGPPKGDNPGAVVSFVEEERTQKTEERTEAGEELAQQDASHEVGRVLLGELRWRDFSRIFPGNTVVLFGTKSITIGKAEVVVVMMSITHQHDHSRYIRILTIISPIRRNGKRKTPRSRTRPCSRTRFPKRRRRSCGGSTSERTRRTWSARSWRS